MHGSITAWRDLWLGFSDGGASRSRSGVHIIILLRGFSLCTVLHCVKAVLGAHEASETCKAK